MTQASDLTIICASLLFLAVVLWILWLTVRAIKAERLPKGEPYIPDEFEDDYSPTKAEASHWQEFLIERASHVLTSRMSGRHEGHSISVSWDVERNPPGSVYGNLASWIEAEGERHNVHVRRV